MQAVPLKHLGWKQRDIATALGASEAAVSAGFAAAAWSDRTFASTGGTNLQRLTAAVRTAAVESEKVAAGLEAKA
jgi:hypothetical protein